VITPPRSGPIIDAMPYTDPTAAVYIDLSRNGTAFAIIIRTPLTTPDAPLPATARPTIRAGELGLTAQISDPSSKSAIEVIKMIFVEKC
jgi:hypothetical protein